MQNHPQAVIIGIDVGSVSTKAVVLREKDKKALDSVYLRTHGRPIQALGKALEQVSQKSPGLKVLAAGTTGSGRMLAAKLVGAQTVKNEITTHTLAAVNALPQVQTIIEIGGQDSKLIIVRDRMPVDFAMNTVCAAGTGSFLDQQAGRLNLVIEELGDLALQSNDPAAISGRCTVFAETDMIHKQQMGAATKDIVAGLCRSLVRNYLGTVARGKQLLAPVVFQGGVAANPAIVKEFEKQLGTEVFIPPNFGVAGAFGAALLAAERIDPHFEFQGFELLQRDYEVGSFTCHKCEESCTVLKLYQDGKLVACWNDRCGKYSR